MYREYMRFTLGTVVIVLQELVVKRTNDLWLQYRLQVWHGDILVKGVEINTFHLAVFAFHKTIDLEVKANEQGS